MKRLLALTIFITTLHTPCTWAEDVTSFIKPYTKLLEKHVHAYEKNGIQGQGVHYKAWQQDPLHQEALNLLTKSKITDLKNKEEKLSFWINAFNLLVIDIIIKQGEQKSIQNLGGLAGDPWNDFNWKIGGKTYTLEVIQQQILRNLNEPRAYFALACAAVSCPDLKNKPYTVNRIYSQLEAQTKKYLQDPRRGVKIVEPADKRSYLNNLPTYKISKIFQWYNGNFSRGNVERFIGRYINVDQANFDGYIPYDWSLNTPTGQEPINHNMAEKVSYLYE